MMKETTPLSYHPQHPHGSVVLSPNHSDHENHMPSTSSWLVTIPPPLSPTFTGLIIWERKLSYLTQHTVWESTSR